MTFVKNIDECVTALQSEIHKLKVKADENIPTVAKLNKITQPSICAKSVQYLFKIGSSYYERDPQTIEEVDNRLALLRQQAETDKALIESEHQSNSEAIANNLKIHEKVRQVMKDLGVPDKWSRSYYKTASSRKQTVETNVAGYIGDLQRNVPTSDDSQSKLYNVKQTMEAIERYASSLKQKIKEELAKKAKEEKAKKEVVAMARLQVKYNLSEHSDWWDVMKALDSKNKYFMLARAGEETRNDWNDGFGKVESALDSFDIETEEDKEIWNEYSGILQGEERDGRVFRDCEYNYSFLYTKVDEDLMSDYRTLQEYYQSY